MQTYLVLYWLIFSRYGRSTHNCALERGIARSSTSTRPFHLSINSSDAFPGPVELVGRSERTRSSAARACLSCGVHAILRKASLTCATGLSAPPHAHPTTPTVSHCHAAARHASPTALPWPRRWPPPPCALSPSTSPSLRRYFCARTVCTQPNGGDPRESGSISSIVSPLPPDPGATLSTPGVPLDPGGPRSRCLSH